MHDVQRRAMLGGKPKRPLDRMVGLVGKVGGDEHLLQDRGVERHGMGLPAAWISLAAV
jgi:hypothetical protein